MTWFPSDAVTVHRYNNMDPIFSAHTIETTALKMLKKERWINANKYKMLFYSN